MRNTEDNFALKTTFDIQENQSDNDNFNDKLENDDEGDGFDFLDDK